MRRAVVPLLLTTALAGCGGHAETTADLGPLADQADRVAASLERGDGCAAVDALEQLRTLAQDVPADVRTAVTSFADTAGASVACPPEDTEDDGADDGEDAGEGEDGPGRGRGRARGHDRGRGGDDD
jgi:hypothetical protein